MHLLYLCAPLTMSAARSRVALRGALEWRRGRGPLVEPAVAARVALPPGPGAGARAPCVHRARAARARRRADRQRRLR